MEEPITTKTIIFLIVIILALIIFIWVSIQQRRKNKKYEKYWKEDHQDADQGFPISRRMPTRQLDEMVAPSEQTINKPSPSMPVEDTRKGPTKSGAENLKELSKTIAPIILTILIGGACIYVILSKNFEEGDTTKAWTALTFILGYWFPKT